MAVIVALGRRPAEDLDLPIVQSKAAIDGRDLRLERPLIREKQPGRAALDDRRRDCRAVDVGERLGGEDDARILLAECLQPFPKLFGEAAVVEGEPAFVDDEQGWTPVEPIADAVEEVGENRGRGAGADKALGLEGLDVGLAEAFRLGVEQPSPGSADGVRLQGLFQRVGLQENREARDGPLGKRSGGERSQRRPQMLLEFGSDGHRFAGEQCRDPLGRPGPFSGVIEAGERL